MSAIYLNNAATSFPKPAAVVDVIRRWLEEPPSDPGRDSSAAPDPLTACRIELADLFGVDAPSRIAILPSATYALNLVIQGLLVPGSHVVTTVFEHNSVLRPIAHRGRDYGVGAIYIRPEPSGRITPHAVASEIVRETRLIAVTHASNVTGSIQPVVEIAEIAAAAGVPLLIDASQSAGAVRLVHRNLPGRVYIAFAGHKGLLGLPGTGGLVLPQDDDLPQLIVGGTGVRSESLIHPADLPLRYEAGTPNLCGVVGLLAGLRSVQAKGIEAGGAHRHNLITRLRSSLETLAGVRVLPFADNDGRAGVVSFTVDGWSAEEVGYTLDKAFGIITRSGLHCAPLIHQEYNTAPLGTVRASVGLANTAADIDALVAAIAQLTEGGSSCA